MNLDITSEIENKILSKGYKEYKRITNNFNIKAKQINNKYNEHMPIIPLLTFEEWKKESIFS